jgi:perosamine synthetase
LKQVYNKRLSGGVREFTLPAPVPITFTENEMIPLSVPNLTEVEAANLKECIDSTFVSSVGPFVTRFENLIAGCSQSKEGIATSSGTSGLHLSLVTVGVKRDDLVILPSFTFIASANAISHCGATPWLFDIDPNSWTLDPTLLAHHLKQDTVRNAKDELIHKKTGRRVSAIMPVYTLGHPADMDPILKTAQSFRLPVVVDAAAAIGSTYRNLPLGKIGAELTVFSFNGNKTITTGGGGGIIGNDQSLIKRARHLSTTARVGSGYDHDQVGYNYRMTNLQAAVGVAQMERLEELVGMKRKIRDIYANAFVDHTQLKPLPRMDWAVGADWFSGFYFSEALPSQVNEFRQKLRAMNIDARPFWKPVHLQSPYAAAPRTMQKNGEAIWENIVTLPCSTNISDEEIEIVINAVEKLLTSNSNRIRTNNA